MLVMTDMEKRLYEKEIKSLRKELNETKRRLEIAEKYKNDYKVLVGEYQRKIKEVDELKKTANLLNNELMKLLKDNLMNQRRRELQAS